MGKPIYITTAIPYVNAKPHLGHALEFVQTDTIARFYKQLGKKVITLTGSDENALKNIQAAEEENLTPQEFVDKNAKLFLELTKKLNTDFDVFQKGTNPQHFQSSQQLWLKCQKDIYKKQYQGLYCLGCEAFYTKDEINENGECYEHPGKKLEKVSETNYFFQLSKYQKQLIEIIKNNQVEIIPDFRKKEILNFLSKPLLDISISRSNERAKNWGVPVPNDPTQRIYVWFDALNIYRSGVDEKIWPADIHIIGKGIIRFHAVYWLAFLLSAQLSLPKKIFVHGYINIDGQKMSKTLGNVIDPNEIINKYGTDALRYYLLKEVSPYDDGNFSWQRMEEVYKANLANELGNLISRLTRLAEKDELIIKINENYSFDKKTIKLFENFQFNLILELIWSEIKKLNKAIDDFAPWKKSPRERKNFLIRSFKILKSIAWYLKPFLPQTSEKILKNIKGKIKSIKPLFPKIVYLKKND